GGPPRRLTGWWMFSGIVLCTFWSGDRLKGQPPAETTTICGANKRPYADARLRGDTRGGGGSVHQELAVGVACTLRADRMSALGASRKTFARSELYRFLPRRLFGSIHSTCLSALVTDRAMEAWYPPSIA